MSSIVFDGHILDQTVGQMPDFRPGSVSLEGDRIGAVGAISAAGTGLAIMPPLINAHDHGRGQRSVAFGAADQALEVWLATIRTEPPVDPYLRALVAFGRLAQSGIAAANHCHNSQDPNRLIEEAEAVSRAAKDVGIRIAFAVPFMGRNPLAYGDPQPLFDRLPKPQAEALRQSVMNRPWYDRQFEAFEAITQFEHACFQVQYGPTGPQWVEDDMLATIAERSSRDGRRIHMHVFETRLQREWGDASYPQGVIQHLDQIGLLSERFTIAHGVHLTDADCALLAERGVFVSVNTSSNLRLRSGIAPVGRFLEHGVRFGLGLDGMAFDDDEDGLRELRLLWQLQQGWGLDVGLTKEQLFRAVLAHGRHSVLGDDGGGRIEPGAPADLLLLKTDRMLHDVIDERASLMDMFMGRVRAEDVTGLWVGGREVVKDGQLCTIDLAAAEAELLAQARHSAPLQELPDLVRLRAATADYYRCGCHRQRSP